MKKVVMLSVCILGIILLGLSDMKRQKNEIRLETGKEKTDAVPVSAGTKEGYGETRIRVLLKNGSAASEYHEMLEVASQNGYTVSDGTRVWQIQPGQKKIFDGKSQEFEGNDVLSLKSADGIFELPALERERQERIYSGELELRRVREGILVINILPLEEYLCGVVPSEMPSSYPEEALKAQAVCARTYALQQMEEGRAEEFYADVDDSVSYQVYNNQDRTPGTDQAVHKTAGKILTRDGALEEAFYYSTSCGLDVDIDLSGEAVFAAFISENHIRAYEAGEPWYRWKTEVRLDAWENAASVRVAERLPNGRAERLCVTDTMGNEEEIEGEYNIRKFLAGGAEAIVLQDGEEITDMELLPSAFFVLQPFVDDNGILKGYTVRGGGYGHGVGMSQNGAKHMAEQGMDYEEILENYYPQAKVTDAAGR